MLSRDRYTRQLLAALPYPEHWYESLDDRQLYAVYMNFMNKELGKIRDIYNKDDQKIQERVVIKRQSEIPLKADGTIDLIALQKMHAFS